MATMGTKTATNTPWDDKFDKSNHLYAFSSESDNIANQINIIHGFVSMILQESQDIDPKFSKVVDKYFWDLV